MAASSPLSSRGLGRRILSPETGVRIPVAVLPGSALESQKPRLAGAFLVQRQKRKSNRMCAVAVTRGLPEPDIRDCQAVLPQRRGNRGRRIRQQAATRPGEASNTWVVRSVGFAQWED